MSITASEDFEKVRCWCVSSRTIFLFSQKVFAISLYSFLDWVYWRERMSDTLTEPAKLLLLVRNSSSLGNFTTHFADLIILLFLLFLFSPPCWRMTVLFQTMERHSWKVLSSFLCFCSWELLHFFIHDLPPSFNFNLNI